MKKTGIFLIPLLIFAVISLLGTKLFAAGAISPAMLVLISAVAMVAMALIRPKAKTAAKFSPNVVQELLGDFSKDAFAEDPQNAAKFQSAVSDYIQSMPKAALNKLEKLQPLCKTDADHYAVTVAMGMAKAALSDFDGAIKLYNKAVVICPTSQLADAMGSLQQRVGELKKAIDSYEFALDLEPGNLQVRSKLATAHVADGDFDNAIEQAQQVLDLDERNASALATIAICHGVLGHDSLYQGYTAKAVEAGYKAEKITSTVPILKKKFRKTLESMR